MAQICGGTTYDYWWDRKLDAAHKKLQIAADRWSSKGPGSLDAGSVVSLVLAMLSTWQFESTRPFDEWLRVVKNPEIECLALLPKSQIDVRRKLAARLIQIIEFAVASWAQGDPEDPPTEFVLNWLVAELHSHHGRVRPPIPRIPIFPLSD